MQLQDGETRLAGIINSAMDAIVTVGDDWRIQMFNAAAEQMFGYKTAEVLGRELNILLPERYHQTHVDRMQRFAETGETIRRMGSLRRQVGRRSDGEEFPIAVAISRAEVEGRRLFTAIIRDISEQVRTEAALRLLAQAGMVLDSSLDLGLMLERVAALAVPTFADYCVVDIMEQGQVRRTAVTHADPSKTELVRQLRGFPPDLARQGGVPETLRTGKAQLESEITEAHNRAIAQNPEHLALINKLGARARIVVPLIARGQTLGALTFGRAESSPRYTKADLATAGELAGRCALAIDNARLYASQRDASEAARLVAERTARLQAITSALSGAVTPAQVARVILDEGLAVAGASGGAIILASADGAFMEVVQAVGYQQEVVDAYRRAPLHARPALVQVMRTGGPLWLESPETWTDRYPLVSAFQASAGASAGAVLPLVVEGVTFGAMLLSFRQARRFSDEDKGFTLALAQQCAQALDRARLYDAEREARLGAESQRDALQTLLDSMTEGVLSVDSHGVVVRANAFAAHLLQTSVTAIEGQKCEAVLPLLPGPEGLEFNLGENVRRTLKLREALHRDDLCLALREGRLVPVSVTVTPARGQPGCVVLFRDITQWREVEEMRQSFVSLVSHELRTPLHHIKGFASTLLQEDVQWDAETEHDFLVTIDHEADRLTRLVDDLLEMSRLEGGRLRLERRSVAVRDVLKAGMGQAAPFLSMHEVTVDAEDGVRLMGDPALLERVLVNLLENAAKYSPGGSRIDVRAWRKAGEVVIAVADQGPGIPPADRERVFEKFVRLDRPGQAGIPGTGLGLAICGAIVGQHGGRIWVEGEAGKGATFCFTLPADPGP